MQDAWTEGDYLEAAMNPAGYVELPSSTPAPIDSGDAAGDPLWQAIEKIIRTGNTGEAWIQGLLSEIRAYTPEDVRYWYTRTGENLQVELDLAIGHNPAAHAGAAVKARSEGRAQARPSEVAYVESVLLYRALHSLALYQLIGIWHGVPDPAQAARWGQVLAATQKAADLSDLIRSFARAEAWTEAYSEGYRDAVAAVIAIFRKFVPGFAEEAARLARKAAEGVEELADNAGVGLGIGIVAALGIVAAVAVASRKR